MGASSLRMPGVIAVTVAEDASRIAVEKRIAVSKPPANLDLVSRVPAPEKKGGLHRRLAAWEAGAHRVLHRLHLDRIRIKLLVFAVVATLVPTFTLSYHSYSMNREYVNAKITEELRNASSQTAREFNLWLKERFYESRVFSTSYEVTENLEQLGRGRNAGRQAEAVRRLTEYLASVRAKFSDYDDLCVLGLDGERLVPAAGEALRTRLPREWTKQIRADDNVVGEPYRDAGRDSKAVIAIAVPIKAANGRLLGAMAARLNFEAIEKIVKSFAVGHTGGIHIVDRHSRIIVTSAAAADLTTRLPAAATTKLLDSGDATTVYADAGGQSVIGTMRPVAVIGWTVVRSVMGLLLDLTR